MRISKQTADFIKISSGNIILTGCGFAVSMYLARSFSTEEFGRYATFNALLFTFSLLLDMGLSTGMVALVKQQRFPAETLFSSLLSLKYVIFLAVVIVSCITALVLTPAEFHASMPLLATLIGGALLSLHLTAQSCLQSEEKFNAYTILTALTGIARMMLILIAGALSLLTLNSAVIITSIAGLTAFIYLPRQFRISIDFSVLAHIWRYSVWIGLSSLLGIIALRLDLYLLASVGRTTDAGIYAAAFQLAFAFPIITMSLATQLFPKAASLHRIEDQKLYVRKVIRFTPLVIAGVVLIASCADFMIPMIFGDKYRSAVLPFIILQSVFMCGIIFTPLGLLVHARKQPYILTLMILMQIVINIILDLLLIPRFGAVGAAWGTFGRYIAGFLFMSTWIWYAVFREQSNRRG